MNPGHRVCYVASEGKEVAVREYKMLVAYSADPATVSAPATPRPSSVLVTNPVSKFWSSPLRSQDNSSKFHRGIFSFELHLLLRRSSYPISNCPLHYSPFISTKYSAGILTL